MNFFKKCPGCNVRRFYIKTREITLPHVKIKVKSEKPLCKHCLIKLTTIK